MKLILCWAWELPQKLDGNAIIFDINAATTNICLILSKNVKDLFIVNEENVSQVKEEYKDCLVIGESKILGEDFFDSGNNSNEIDRLSLEARTVLYMSNNGSRAIEEAIKKDAKNAVIGSYTNIHTVASWVKQKPHETYYLISAGEKTFQDPKAKEDILCTKTLKDILRGKDIDWQGIFSETRQFIKANYQDFSDEETDIQLDIDRFPLLPICRKDNGLIRIDTLTIG